MEHLFKHSIHVFIKADICLIDVLSKRTRLLVLNKYIRIQ